MSFQTNLSQLAQERGKQCNQFNIISKSFYDKHFLFLNL